MRLMLCITFVCLLLSAGPASAQIAAINGYDGYRFGMSVEQAARVRPQAPYTRCQFQNVVGCVEYETNVANYKAKVIIQFKGNPVSLGQIVVQFGQIEDPIEYPCRQAGKVILGLLIDKYGAHPRTQSHKATWTSPYGGQVSFTDLCVDDQRGLSIVAYSPSNPL